MVPSLKMVIMVIRQVYENCDSGHLGEVGHRYKVL